jgi:hypothetical protein
MSYFISDTEEYDIYKCISKEFYNDIYSEIDVNYPTPPTPPTQNEDIDNIISMYSSVVMLPIMSFPNVHKNHPKKNKWWVIFKRKMNKNS